MAALEIQNINKFYGATQALFDVSLSVGTGEFVTLLGPSGSGKTTLLKILAGFEPVSAGAITLNGQDVTKLSPETRNFGLVFQGYALFPHMTVFDNIAYPLRVRRVGRAEIAERVSAILDLVQLGRFVNRRPNELSGGQQQRVALARALVFKPDLLLLDEPMSALDKKLRTDLQEELRDIHRSLGTTFINVTHDQEEAMHMSDRIAVMDQGRIEQFGTAFELYRQPKSRFVADFVGKSNILEGVLDRSETVAIFRGHGVELALPGCARKGGPADLLIRPEDLTVTREPATHGAIGLPARVLHSTYSGDRALYTLAVEGAPEFLAYGAARSGIFDDGESVTISFTPDGCTLVG
ncbi:ABC transporter ATP-binding protein [Phaeovulum sp.]|uniref:ABC transporter ATP-binding protein n=1 Tax=Phaeovulum sp. TaxID=2934796 RepID=UPI0039E5B185